MKIVLVSFYNRFDEYPTKYSLGTLRIAAYISKYKEIDVSIIPYNLNDTSSLEDLVGLLKQEDPCVVGLPAYLWTWKTAMEICERISSLSCLIVVGGPEVQNHSEENLDDNKMYISGDGELFWDNLVNKLMNGANKEQLLTATHIDDHQKMNGSFRANNSTDITYELPVFSDRFFGSVKHVDIPKEFVWYETSRGCPYRCGYCGHKNREGVAFFDNSFIENEIRFIGQIGIQRMFIVDPIVGGTKNNGKLVFKLLGKHAPKTKITAYLRPEYIDDEYIELLKSVSIEEIRIGIQTLNPQVPKWIRNNNLYAITDRLPKLTQSGIPWRAELIVGLPGDNPVGFLKSLRFVMDELHPTFLYAYHLSVLKETPLFLLKDAAGDQWIKTCENDVSAESSYSYSKKEMTSMLRTAGIVNDEYNKCVVRCKEGMRNLIDNFDFFANKYLKCYDESVK